MGLNRFNININIKNGENAVSARPLVASLFVFFIMYLEGLIESVHLNCFAGLVDHDVHNLLFLSSNPPKRRKENFNSSNNQVIVYKVL